MDDRHKTPMGVPVTSTRKYEAVIGANPWILDRARDALKKVGDAKWELGDLVVTLLSKCEAEDGPVVKGKPERTEDGKRWKEQLKFGFVDNPTPLTLTVQPA